MNKKTFLFIFMLLFLTVAIIFAQSVSSNGVTIFAMNENGNYVLTGFNNNKDPVTVNFTITLTNGKNYLVIERIFPNRDNGYKYVTGYTAGTVKNIRINSVRK